MADVSQTFISCQSRADLTPALTQSSSENQNQSRGNHPSVHSQLFTPITSCQKVLAPGGPAQLKMQTDPV